MPRFNKRAGREDQARIDVGDIVTIVGSAIPFGELADPSGAAFSAGSPIDDPLI